MSEETLRAVVSFLSSASQPVSAVEAASALELSRVTAMVQQLRTTEDLLKPPGVAETLDWARAVHALGGDEASGGLDDAGAGFGMSV